MGFEGEINFDSTRSDGRARKLADTSRLRKLGWSGARPLADGIAQTYAAWRREAAEARLAGAG